MGSEMCIRDRDRPDPPMPDHPVIDRVVSSGEQRQPAEVPRHSICLLYTSDAADERSSVDLGGRRIIKKKKAIRHTH